MSIDPKLLVSNFPVIMGSLALLIAGKTILVAAVGKLFGVSLISAIRVGLLLAPGGEFAFVAFGEAVNQVTNFFSYLMLLGNIFLLFLLSKGLFLFYLMGLDNYISVLSCINNHLLFTVASIHIYSDSDSCSVQKTVFPYTTLYPDILLTIHNLMRKKKTQVKSHSTAKF